MSAVASTAFTVVVTTESLQALVTTFSTRPRASATMNATLSAAARARNRLARILLLVAFEIEVQLEAGRALTREQAATLIRLVRPLY